MWCFSPASFLATQAGISGQNRFFVESIVAEGVRRNFYHLIVSKDQLHGNLILRLFRAVEFLLLYCHKYLIRNNGLMGTSVEIPIYETVVLNLNSASADSF